MLNNKTSGMSLIELMIVLSIIALSAVFAIQAYKSYTIKSNLTQIIAAIEQYQGYAQAAFTSNDQYPNQISNLTVSTYTNISSAGLNIIYYGRSTNKQSAYFQFYTTDLKVPGFVISNGSGSGGANCRVTAALVPTADGHMRLYCGQWDGSSTDVPLTYLPQSCQDTNISALIT